MHEPLVINSSSSTRHRMLLAGQLLGTLAILAFIPGNVLKLVALLVLWVLTFRRFSRPELIFFVVICGFFTLMNAMSLQQGIFQFAEPDLLLMPVWEVFMWGFYLLHTKRLIGGPAPSGRTAGVWALAIAYSIAFSAIQDQQLLLIVTTILLLGGLALFHERLDLFYAGYMVFVGACIEYTGVHAGLWHYPGDPIGGVPIWFVTLWGGVGLLLRRLALPIVYRFEHTIERS